MTSGIPNISRRELLAGCLAGAAVVGAGCGGDPDESEPPNRPPDVSEMELVFQDSFADSLDSDRWHDRYPWESRTHNYNGYANPDNATVREGSLVLRAESESKGGKSYTTGVVSTKRAFSTGYFEARVRVPPRVAGLWPAFWMTPDNDWPPEIDVFEFFGADPEAYMSYHYRNANGEKARERASFGGPNFSADYCDFGVDWSSDRIVWYVDGTERFRYDGDFVTRDSMHVIFNLGVDPDFLDSPAPEHLPATLEIDSFGVWQR